MKLFDGNGTDAATAAPHEASGPGTASATLRDARQRLGYELRDVASTLRIRYPYLEAIERGRFDELPGATYANGFLRSYAEFLGLDAEEILRRYKDEVAGRVGKQELYFPTPASENRVPGGGLVFATLILAGLAYGGWYYLSATDRSVVDLVPTLPERFVSLLDRMPWNTTPDTPHAVTAEDTPAAPDTVASAAPPAAPATPAVPAAPPAATPAKPPAAPTVTAQAQAQAQAPAAPATGGGSLSVPSAAPVRAPASPATTPAAASPAASPGDEDEADMAEDPTPLKADGAPQTVAAQAPAPPPPAVKLPEGKAYGNPNPAAHVQIRATQDSWLKVRDGGEAIFTRVLKAGEIYRVPDKPGLHLQTGNAGGLVLVIDGVPGAPLGSVGQVMRDVSLDAKLAR